MKKFLYLALIPALIFQLIGAYFYFIVFEGTQFAKIAYSITKILLIGWPLLWMICKYRPKKFTGGKRLAQSLLWGLISGICIVGIGGLIFLYFQNYFLQFVPEILVKIKDFGMSIPQKYILFSIFLSILHALLEEYYWRWFIFGGLLKYFPPMVAGIISSVGFGSHHFIILGQYFPFWTTFALGMAVIGGGLFWCFLYYKTKTILGSWISHIFVDGIIMGIGYMLIF